MSLSDLPTNSTLPTTLPASSSHNPTHPTPTDLFWIILVSAIALYGIAVILDRRYQRGKERGGAEASG
ncbi:hypothetical protein G7Y79_00009g027580 [Physcia stellaris]|nr:hypothetical protein G7Y79_00009g027580 [Physcia stellaris]